MRSIPPSLPLPLSSPLSVALFVNGGGKNRYSGGADNAQITIATVTTIMEQKNIQQ